MKILKIRILELQFAKQISKHRNRINKQPTLVCESKYELKIC